MKKRILLSLVSFFAMTAMWASLTEAYKITVTGANGKTGTTAELTLNMHNRNAIAGWDCTLVLPAGVVFKSATLVNARYPEAYEAAFVATDNGDGTVSFSCEGEEGVAMTGTAGAVATVVVEIPADFTPGEYTVNVKNTVLYGANNVEYSGKATEFAWTIEQGEEPGVEGDLNGDGTVDIADAVAVLSIMASNEYVEAADFNNDGMVDIADFVAVLAIMAGASQN
jgi:hypothetical protein